MFIRMSGTYKMYCKNVFEFCSKNVCLRKIRVHAKNIIRRYFKYNKKTITICKHIENICHSCLHSSLYKLFSSRHGLVVFGFYIGNFFFTKITFFVQTFIEQTLHDILLYTSKKKTYKRFCSFYFNFSIIYHTILIEQTHSRGRYELIMFLFLKILHYLLSVY